MERETLRKGGNVKQRKGVDYQSLRKDLYSIFIDNIPLGRDERWVRALFSKDGKAMDVFIPTRGRRATNSRFGFVRYKTMGEAKASIRRWNGANVGNAKLLVVLADAEGKPRDRGRTEGRRSELQYDGRRPGRVAPVWNPKPVGGGQVRVPPTGVIGSSKNQTTYRRLVKLVAFQEQEDWLHNTIVANLKSPKLSESLEKEMRRDCIAFVKIMPVEGSKVLIQFECGEDLDRCLTEDYGAVLRNFSKLQRWSEDAMPISRSVWISILGLPMRAWTEENGEILAAPHGVFLKMDDRDVRFVGEGRARMLIETSKVERICEVVEAEIADKVYVVSLCEDCCLGGCGIDSPDSSSMSREGPSVPEVSGCASEGGGSGKNIVDLGGGEEAVAGGAPSRGISSEEEEISKFEFSGKRTVIAESILSDSIESTQQVPETCEEVAEKGTSWAATVRKNTKEVGKKKKKSTQQKVQAKKTQTFKGQSKAADSNSKGLSLVSSRIVERSDNSEEEDPLRYCGKHFSTSKVTRRKDHKEKKVVRYKRRKKLREAGVYQNKEIELENVQISEVDELEAEERERRQTQSKEAEETFRIALRVGIKGNLPEDQMIQIFEDHLQKEN
ncbi:unnamed protein product [Rhodiola kirilowii]